MKLRLTYVRQGASVDLEVVAEGDATVGDLARALAERDPAKPYAVQESLTLAVGRDGGASRVLSPSDELRLSDVRSGSTVSVVQFSAASGTTGDAATLIVLEGPDRGRRFPLRTGTTTIGRSPEAGVQLSDLLVSKTHAKVHVAGSVEIVDTGSSNGVEVDGRPVERAIVRSIDRIRLGDTVLQIELHPVASFSGPGAAIDDATFVRSPRVVVRFAPESHAVPDVPSPVTVQRFPVIALLAPILLGAGLYAVTQQLASLIFVLLSPVMLIGQWLEARLSRRRQEREARESFDADLRELDAVVRERQAEERRSRLVEDPATNDVVAAIRNRSELLWSRRPDLGDFLTLRLGLGEAESRVSTDAPGGGQGFRELKERLQSTRQRLAVIPDVPLTASLGDCGSIGVAGAGEAGATVARALVLQVAGLHAPADVAIAAFVGPATADRWSWLSWLPHTGMGYSPLRADHVVSGATASTELLDDLERLLLERRDSDDLDLPAVVVVVEDDAIADSSRLVALAEKGPEAGIHLIWVAPSKQLLPAACRVFLSVEGDAAVLGDVVGGRLVRLAGIEQLDLATAASVARQMAPVVDSGMRADDGSGLPRSAPFLSLAGVAIAEDGAEVVERWIETESLSGRRIPGARVSSTSLRALVGVGSAGPLHLDLSAQGPHALVGGTTGAGKSELLQSWILGMAAAHSPERVTFLFVDYKGGSAFGDCVQLPHSVGLVTDLSPHLVRRALVSLSAELRYREHVLNEAEAKDLRELEERGLPGVPPRLVIVVDEFAALVADVPDFVDGVVNIAQRGRSLGLHLILATQRPAGVIKDNLRANTNLRLALRMADAADSTDVLGAELAAAFDPDIPGRAAFRSGSGQPTVFQAAYAGARTATQERRASIAIRELALAGGTAWPEPPVTVSGSTDLERVVSTVVAAAAQEGVPEARRPWLPQLPAACDLAELPNQRSDHRLAIGLMDVPDQQQQLPLVFQPDADGNLLVIGGGGSGKSTTLRSLAAVAGFTVRGGPVHVYALDFGSRGLSSIEVLPHVAAVVKGDDEELVGRVLRRLRGLIESRSALYSAAKAATITEYREISGRGDEPRILLLIDGAAAFRQAHDVGSSSGFMESLTAIAADGRQVGIHVVLTADRVASLPSSLASYFGRRIVLRVSDEAELGLSGVPRDLFGPDSPPGRGWSDGCEVQVAVLGGAPSVAEQSTAMDRLADAIARNTSWPSPEPVVRLPEQIPLGDLPDVEPGRVAIGVDDISLGVASVPFGGTFVVAGPPGSGRTSTVETLVASARRSVPDVRTMLVTPARGRLAASTEWDAVAVADDGGDSERPLAEAAESIKSDGRPWLLVVESPPELLGTPFDLDLQDLAKLVRSRGWVVSEGETQPMAGSWPLLQALRSSRRGIVLQPDQTDGDLLFRTQFPRLRRADFPVGRGLLVREGRASKVQVAQR
jgi:S-DNA-T family DNA segregation ATPase FtsK/SpoIIIE